MRETSGSLFDVLSEWNIYEAFTCSPIPPCPAFASHFEFREYGNYDSIYDAWRAIAETAQWRTPEAVKTAHPKASILKGGRVVFNIKANDYRLIAVVQYAAGVMVIRFFGSHEEYDQVNAETV
jgi:mRNA interferase HigB